MADSVSDQFELLGRREWLVRRLSEDGTERAELRAAEDVSRSTVDRGVAELADAGLVEEVDGRVRLTLYGQVVHEEFRSSTARLAGVERAAAVVNALPADTELDTALFAACDVSEGAAARTRHESVVEAADSVRGVLLALSLPDVRVYYDEALSGTEFQVVFTPDLTAQLVGDAQQELGEGLDQPNVAVRRTDDHPPYSLLLADVEGDTHACVCVQAADGIVEGWIESTRPDAVEWAESQFEAIWSRATSLEPS